MPPGDLFQIREFEFEDINATQEQAYDALAAARRIWKEQHMPDDVSPRSEGRWDVTRKLCLRILALFDSHPLSVKLSSVAFMALPEFEWADQDPTLKEVVVAFETAHRIWKLKQQDSERT